VRLVDPVSAAPPAQDPITGMALRSYTDQQSNSAELTPWGAQAVWNGQYNASTAATLGTGKFAFVIDTGVSSTTADLNVDTQRGFNWINNSSNAEDDNGHGTHVAGTIGALVNNYGVVGVAPGTRIIPLKVLDANGSGSLSYSVSAVNYALQMINAPGSPVTSANAVVNLSLGAKTTTYKSLDSAIYNASKYGLRFAIAAGNSGSDVDGFTPARTGNDANVYTVSAVDNAYRMPSWSNWDKLAGSDKVDNIDFATPGVDVLSLSNRSGYLARMSGTSMASPHMAGLLLINNPANPFVRTDLATPYFSGTADPIAHL
jgi:subtilisin